MYFFNMSSIKDPSISVFTGIGLLLFLFLPALILPNSNCLQKILFAKEGMKIFKFWKKEVLCIFGPKNQQQQQQQPFVVFPFLSTVK